MTVIAGIDPGKTGAISFINTLNYIIDIYDWVDCSTMNNILADHYISFAVLEKVASRPKQGVVSTFNFGENFGMWQGLLTAHNIPYTLATPQKWMKGQVVPSDHKNKKKRALTVCRRLYPGDEHFKLEKHHNRADATLIARYALLRGLVK